MKSGRRILKSANYVNDNDDRPIIEIKDSSTIYSLHSFSAYGWI